MSQYTHNLYMEKYILIGRDAAAILCQSPFWKHLKCILHWNLAAIAKRKQKLLVILVTFRQFEIF